MTEPRRKYMAEDRRVSGTWWHDILQATFLFILVFLAGLIPRLNVVTVLLIGALSACYIVFLAKEATSFLRSLKPDLVLVAMGCLCAYLFLNALWALDPGSALNKAALVAALAMSVLLAGHSFKLQRSETLRKSATYAIWGAAIGFAITCFEFASDHLLQWWILKTWPAIRPEGNSIQVLVERNGEIFVVPPSQYRTPPENEILQILTDGLNRHLVALLLVAWPVLALCRKVLSPGIRWPVVAVLALFTLGAILSGSSATAKVALGAGMMTFLLASYVPRVTFWAVSTSWCMAVLLVLPLALLSYKAELHKAPWLFESARDRVAIWGFTAERAIEHPVMGIGTRSTRVLVQRAKKKRAEADEPYRYEPPAVSPGQLIAPPRLGHHAHNQFLQVWFELGAIGAALLLAVGLGILRVIRGFESTLRPFAFAAFVSACVIAAFGFGLWQTWLLSGYALTAILMQFAARFTATEDDAS